MAGTAAGRACRAVASEIACLKRVGVALSGRENICWGYVTLGWSVLIALWREKKRKEGKTFYWMFVEHWRFIRTFQVFKSCLPASVCVCLCLCVSWTWTFTPFILEKPSRSVSFRGCFQHLSTFFFFLSFCLCFGFISLFTVCSAVFVSVLMRDVRKRSSQLNCSPDVGLLKE